jgi:hypothetical protein
VRDFSRQLAHQCRLVKLLEPLAPGPGLVGMEVDFLHQPVRDLAGFGLGFRHRVTIFRYDTLGPLSYRRARLHSTFLNLYLVVWRTYPARTLR